VGDHADVLAAEAGEQRRLVDRTVAVGRRVDRERLRFSCRPPRFDPYAVVRSRAQIKAINVVVEAVSWITPLHASDSPSISRIQSVTTSSSSVSAGLDCHARPSTAEAGADVVPEDAGQRAVAGK
jgi:hypothetical protein